MNKAFTLTEFLIVIAIIGIIAAIAIPNLIESNKQQKVVPKTITMEEYIKNNKNLEFNSNENIKLDKRFIIETIVTPRQMSNLIHITDTQTKVEYIGYNGQFLIKLEKN